MQKKLFKQWIYMWMHFIVFEGQKSITLCLLYGLKFAALK